MSVNGTTPTTRLLAAAQRAQVALQAAKDVAVEVAAERAKAQAAAASAAPSAPATPVGSTSPPPSP